MYSETFISTANKVISFNIKLGQCLGASFATLETKLVLLKFANN